MKKALIMAINRRTKEKPQTVIEFYEKYDSVDQHGNQRADLSQLIKKHEKMIYQIANRYKYTGVSIDDMFCEGILGLLIAFEKYDISNNTLFSTYAYFWIKQRILQLIKQIKTQYHMSNDIRDENEDDLVLQDRLRIIYYAMSCLTASEKYVIDRRFIKHPYDTLKTISTELKCSEETVRQMEKRAIQKIRNYISNHLNDALNGFIRINILIYWLGDL